ncbi:MAG: ribonuclease E/G [Gammaproteobacteria bacterium]
MSQEILIHTTPKYIQVAYLENHRLCEIDMESHQSALRVGDIYYGKVVRILPAMRVAFMEIGSERTALLHFDDVYLPLGHGYTEVVQYLRIGMLLPVQISKLPRGEKGAVVIGQLQLLGALVIYQPMNTGINVAKRINDEQERLRLYDIIKQVALLDGVMVRSLAVHQPAENVCQELQAFQGQWQQIQELMQNVKKPQLLRAEYGLTCTFIRDHISAQTLQIYVDEAQYLQVKNYMSIGLAAWLPCVQKVKDKQAPWKTYHIDKIIKAALLPNVGLPSGGSIVIERTEAMTVIDVNTEQAVQAAFQTNKEAAQIIAQQIRLRNISGIIVVDFIRMRESTQQEEILAILRDTFAQDPIFTMVNGFSPLGLVEISRKRRSNSWTEDYKNEE